MKVRQVNFVRGETVKVRQVCVVTERDSESKTDEYCDGKR